MDRNGSTPALVPNTSSVAKMLVATARPTRGTIGGVLCLSKAGRGHALSAADPSGCGSQVDSCSAQAGAPEARWETKEGEQSRIQSQSSKLEHAIQREALVPVTESSSQEILSLPMYPELTVDQVHYICQSVKDYFRPQRMKRGSRARRLRLGAQ